MISATHSFEYNQASEGGGALGKSSHPRPKFGLFTSRRDDAASPEGRYRYKSFELSFPESILREAKGKTVTVRLLVLDENQEVVRYANAVVPNSDRARVALRRTLERGSMRASPPSALGKSMSPSECEPGYKLLTWGVGEYIDGLWGYSVEWWCTWVGTDPDPNAQLGFEGEPPGGVWGYGGSALGGDGSTGPGMEYGPDPEPISCAEIQAVVAGHEQALRDLFQQSLNTRKEHMGFLRPLTQSDGSVTWDWLPVTEYTYQSGCRAAGRVPGPLYGGTIYVHSHPFMDNDLVSTVTQGDSDCTHRGRYLANNPGIGGDASRLAKMRASGSGLRGLRGIGLMVDGSGIVAFNTSAEHQRCVAW
jgi:hypothetical protein